MIWSTVLGDIGRIHIQVESNTETCSQNKTFQDKSFHCPRYRYGTWGTNGHTKLANTIKYVRIHWILLNHIRPSSRQTIICHKWNKVMCWVVSHPSTIGLGQVMILHCSAGRTHTRTQTLETWLLTYTVIPILSNPIWVFILGSYIWSNSSTFRTSHFFSHMILPIPSKKPNKLQAKAASSAKALEAPAPGLSMKFRPDIGLIWVFP